MNYIGEIYKILPMESKERNGNNYFSRKFSIEQKRFDEYTGEQKKSNFIEFEMKGQNNCSSLDLWKPGTKVSVTFFIEGSEYDKKDANGNKTGEKAIFNKIIATKIELPSAQSATAASPAAPAAPSAPSAAAPAQEASDENDLPFD